MTADIPFYKYTETNYENLKRIDHVYHPATNENYQNPHY